MYSLDEINQNLKLFPTSFTMEKTEAKIGDFLDKYIIFHILEYDLNIKFRKSIYNYENLTNKGKEFYKELKSFDNKRYKFFESKFRDPFNKYDPGIIIAYTDLIDYRVRIYRMIRYGDALNKNNIDLLTLIYAIVNICDVLGNFGVDLEIAPIVPNTLSEPDVNQSQKKELIDRKRYKAYINNIKKLVDKEIEYKIVKENNEEKFYIKYLGKEFSEKFSEDINRMYYLYFSNFAKFNIPSYCKSELFAIFQGNCLIRLDVDHLLKEYPNVTRDEILTLCLYKLNADNVIKYLKMLNKCDLSVKSKLMELIKPINYYFPYITKDNYFKYELDHHISEASNKSSDFQEAIYSNIYNVINGNTSFDDEAYTNDYLKFLSREFRSTFYCGYFYYIAAFQNFFLKQLNIYEKIVDRADFQDILDKLLTLKTYILDNKINAGENKDKVMDNKINIIKEFIQKYLNTFLTTDLEFNNDLRDNILNELYTNFSFQEDSETKLMRNCKF